MRQAKAIDYWRDVKNKKFNKSVDLLCLNNMNGIPDLALGSGIYAICGLNGVGKSSVMLSLKDILGLKLREHDIVKLKGKKLEAIISSNKKREVYSNEDNIKFIDFDENKNKAWFIDHEDSINVIKFLSQDYLDELLQQYDPVILNEKDIEELNYIIGKNYEKIELINIEDEDGEAIPYFIVQTYGTKYDTLKMGLGEHWLFYIWWMIYRTPNHSLALIEEPETFVGIRSQEKLMNHLAKKASKNGITFIVTTHSPYIVRNIGRQNITVISRYGNCVDICNPNNNTDILNDLGLETKKKGTIFVEDNVARLFLTTIISRYDPNILKKYNIEFVGGETHITERLNFPYSQFIDYEFIGLYDGDMNGKIDKCEKDKVWKYDFLPTIEAVEVEFRNTIIQKIDNLAETLNKNKSDLIRTLAKIEGENHHDWYTLFSKEIGVSLEVLTETLFNIWIGENDRKEKVKEFELILDLLCT